MVPFFVAHANCWALDGLFPAQTTSGFGEISEHLGKLILDLCLSLFAFRWCLFFPLLAIERALSLQKETALIQRGSSLLRLPEKRKEVTLKW